MRFSAAMSTHDSNPSNSRPPAARINPLVGSHAPAQPQVLSNEPSVSTKPSPPSNSSLPLTPPPPPPPPATSEDAGLESSKAQAKQYPYTAADASTPINLDIASIITNKSAAYGLSLGNGDPLSTPQVRTAAVTGRTVFVKDRLTPTSAPTPTIALRVLERMCRDQKVRNKYHSQKFHERKGLRKKRLRSQRWRARFKTGFKATVNRVIELKKQGW
ncbi:hypothetical protein DCS_04431 [Drechmeria coniospora]|uniref:Ribosomal protein S21 n=1 Tax=Drechmeria coniospora TaxID=98403 RepID=A0A151GK84_DRECN|nr:hypothetical protein DCS_04431 [Drechmeria coniospora]KYK57422.1 hypothetical protein DCS_04431 [Drechmeria coniospora]